MTDAGYIFAGYGLTAAVLGTYAAWVIRRRKALTRLLPPGEK
jgi:heme exporter protein CcmD